MFRHIITIHLSELKIILSKTRGSHIDESGLKCLEDAIKIELNHSGYH